ncbi:MAG: hypothetical protein M1838_002956 [Thelocarpon superellum]|nr:MAG: hypothetical protein M1838_002956 [Thelocarpon superellum]
MPSTSSFLVLSLVALTRTSMALPATQHHGLSPFSVVAQNASIEALNGLSFSNHGGRIFLDGSANATTFSLAARWDISGSAQALAEVADRVGIDGPAPDTFYVLASQTGGLQVSTHSDGPDYDGWDLKYSADGQSASLIRDGAGFLACPATVLSHPSWAVFEDWLSHPEPSQGTLHVDEGDPSQCVTFVAKVNHIEN